jgi:hypothetical protein
MKPSSTTKWIVKKSGMNRMVRMLLPIINRMKKKMMRSKNFFERKRKKKRLKASLSPMTTCLQVSSVYHSHKEAVRWLLN